MRSLFRTEIIAKDLEVVSVKYGKEHEGQRKERPLKKESSETEKPFYFGCNTQANTHANVVIHTDTHCICTLIGFSDVYRDLPKNLSPN